MGNLALAWLSDVMPITQLRWLCSMQPYACRAIHTLTCTRALLNWSAPYEPPTNNVLPLPLPPESRLRPFDEQE
jgi:hypothetical protein